MPLPRVSPRSFLSAAKRALENAIQQSVPVTFVIGNESADLDSLCSAVVLAYLRTYASSSKSNTLYIPLSNIPRGDLSLRPELLLAIRHARLDPDDLITLSDLPSTQNTILPQLVPEKTSWILVDHNALQGELGRMYSSRVKGCIDHHDEENKVPKDCGDEPRIIRKSGSCASLVVQYCREAWDEMAHSGDAIGQTATWGAELARLALAPVLIDTTNLSIPSKTTDADREAVAYLSKRIGSVDGSDFSAKWYFEELTRAKEDIGGLSLHDILRKDYKQWDEGGAFTLGVSSVVKNLEFMIEKAGSELKFFDTMVEFARERKLDICSIMTTSHPEGVFKRELLVWGMNEKGVEAAKKFESDSKEKLGLEMWKDGALDATYKDSWRRCWWQTEVNNSRKQVAPLLRASM